MDSKDKTKTKIHIPVHAQKNKDSAIKDYKDYTENNPNPNSIVVLRARIERLEKIVLIDK